MLLLLGSAGCAELPTWAWAEQGRTGQEDHISPHKLRCVNTEESSVPVCVWKW